MKFIQGHDRTQTHLFPVSIEESIDSDNEVRIIDIFVDSLPLKKLGFDMDFDENGRPAYHPADLLKLYIYGYQNRIRSSRCLEKECKRNIEVIWMEKGLKPDHNTISNFRRDNAKAIKNVFRSTVSIAKHFDLIGGTLIAGDSVKMRAQNSKKNNFNQDKIDRHLAYIENKLEEYNNALAEADDDNKAIIEKEIEKQTQRKENYENLEAQLEATGEEQISTSDPESRQLIVRGNITEVVYNIQTTNDSKEKLFIDYEVTNKNDRNAMGFMTRRAKTILRYNRFKALYDKGFHTGSELKTAQDLGIETIVAIPDTPSLTPDKNYSSANFQYDKEKDTYTCPQNNILTTNGNWYSKNKVAHHTGYRVKHYKTTACKGCPAKKLCTRNARDRGRTIERSEYAEYIEQNRINVEKNKELYKQRQAIVEHPYGTLKRQWGFDYIITKKGKERASADVGFMLIAYNLRRVINIIGGEMLVKYLKVLIFYFLRIFGLIWLKKLRYELCKIFGKDMVINLAPSANRLIFAHILHKGGF